ncbi:flagellar protein FlaG [Paraglaciecola sp.]|nr:flagellar protein FlaG [Paraglaciecola sp.]
MSNDISSLVNNSLEAKPAYGTSSRDVSNLGKPELDKVDTEKLSITSAVEQKRYLDDEVKKSNDTNEIEQSLKLIEESADDLLSMQGRNLMFETSNDSGDYVIKVIDKDTKDVIRQIPSEEFVRVAEKIKDLSEQLSSAQGLLFDSKI